MEHEASYIFNRFRAYAQGVRVLFLIHRKRDGGGPNGTKVEKRISRDEDEFLEHLTELMAIKARSEHNLRIYASCNSRDVPKAIRRFKQEQLAADDWSQPDRNDFYMDCRNRFISALMVPGSRASKFFLLDCDLPLEQREPVVARLVELGVAVMDWYPTRNGFHVITTPFNPALWVFPNASIHKDGLVLLA